MSGYPGQGYHGAGHHGGGGGYGYDNNYPPQPSYNDNNYGGQGGYSQGGYSAGPPQQGYGAPQGGYGGHGGYPPQQQYDSPAPGGYGGPPPQQGGYGNYQQPPPQHGGYGPPQGGHGPPHGGYNNNHYDRYPASQHQHPPPGFDPHGNPLIPPTAAHARAGAQPSTQPLQFGHGAPAGYTFQYSNCTGKRKALLIGINYFGSKAELKGCINDVRNVSAFLIDKYNYKREDMVILTDDQSEPRMRPTKKNIQDAMGWLVKDAQPNDSLFLHYSGTHCPR